MNGIGNYLILWQLLIPVLAPTISTDYNPAKPGDFPLTRLAARTDIPLSFVLSMQ